MNWSESITPLRMQRIALIAPASALRAMLVLVAAAGMVELDETTGTDRGGNAAAAALSAAEPDMTALEQAGRADLMAGENQLRAYCDGAVRRGDVAAVAGWCPESEISSLRERLATVGAAVVKMSPPAGIDPPTLLGDAPAMRRAFAPLVRIYGILPYQDIDPTIPAGLAYVAMFGMMFGDVGHGLMLLAAGMMLRSGRITRLAGLRGLWVFVVGAGIAATGFGLLYGEFFGPTRVLPVLWLNPLDEPVPLMIAAVALGAALLALAYGFGVMNRWREGGARLALYSSSGIAGAATFLGSGVVIAGVLWHQPAILVAGVVAAGAGLVLSVAGMFAESGGGAAGVARSGIGVIDLVMHLGANLISFARLAAFGMTHAALGWVVWQATTAAAGWGVAGLPVAVVVFVVGNVIAFALEALIAGVQALRLEFYELFSRVFAGTGRPFTPWRIPVTETEDAPC